MRRLRERVFIAFFMQSSRILPIMSFQKTRGVGLASLRSLSLRERGACQILQSGCKLTFMAERPPPPQIVQQELLMAAEERVDYL